MKIISLYENFNSNGKELSRLLMQGLLTEERKNKTIDRAKMGINKDGDFTYYQSVHVHPVSATKPYLDKYKIY